MNINITGDPGTGNTFQEIHINSVQNYNPNATTIINNYNVDKSKPAPATEKVMQDAEREQRKAEIMDYVANLKKYVSKEWKNRYESLWKEILSLPEVDAKVYEPGKQHGTTFNRNLIANIIYIMCKEGVIEENNATTLTMALEGDKDHSVRAKLHEFPVSKDITDKILSLLTDR